MRKETFPEIGDYTAYEIGFKTRNCESFSTVLRTHLISENRARFLTPQGFKVLLRGNFEFSFFLTIRDR